MINSAKPKKSLGQNFLTSVGAVNKIVDTALEASKNSKDTTILEIGPGRGVLTEALLKNFPKVLAVEKDDNLFVELGEKFKEEIKTGQLKLIHGDILKLTWPDLEVQPPSKNRDYAIVANIPYYITGQFLRTWLETETPPKFMVLMFQKEVAQRIAARDSKESLLSISIKAYGEPKYIETVKRGSFYPIPNVDSAILLINNISKDFFLRDCSAVPFPAHSKRGEFAIKETAEQSLGPTTNQEKKFFNILRAGFAHKRKFLIKNLEEAVDNKEKLQKAFESCDISPKARAEDLKLEEWKCLIEKI